MTAPKPIEATPNPRLTVGYSRKIATRQYESAEASIFVQADIEGSWNKDNLFIPAEGAVAEAAKLAFFEAKVAVLSQLCLPYDVVENVVIEQIDKVLGPVEIVKNNPRGTTKPVGGGAVGPTSNSDAWNDLLANPDGWFDNRQGKRNPKAPDFKAKNTNRNVERDKALWLDGKGTPDAAVERYVA